MLSKVTLLLSIRLQIFIGRVTCTYYFCIRDINLEITTLACSFTSLWILLISYSHIYNIIDSSHHSLIMCNHRVNYVTLETINTLKGYTLHCFVKLLHQKNISE